jgi:hypothetical protein
MSTDRNGVIREAAELGRNDAREGREPLWYRVGESYVSAETGHIGAADVGAAYVAAYAGDEERVARDLAEYTTPAKLPA